MVVAPHKMLRPSPIVPADRAGGQAEDGDGGTRRSARVTRRRVARETTMFSMGASPSPRPSGTFSKPTNSVIGPPPMMRPLHSGWIGRSGGRVGSAESLDTPAGNIVPRIWTARKASWAPETRKGDQQRSLSKCLCEIVPAKEPLIKLRFARLRRKPFGEPLSALLWKARGESLQLFTSLSDQGLELCKTQGIGCLQVRKSGAKKF
jgi:hypothetical protein